MEPARLRELGDCHVRVVESLNDVVYCILEDGPYAGATFEVQATDKELRVGNHPSTVCIYRRVGWCCTQQAHRILRFSYSKNLVI